MLRIKVKFNNSGLGGMIVFVVDFFFQKVSVILFLMCYVKYVQ